jgi:16S rRNA pseudouridine516 synthase
MGPLPLDETLELGEYRELTDDEIEELKSYKLD